MNKLPFATSPLFCDPIFDGAADPTVIWNQKENSWWMFYTNRRASAINHRQSFLFGTDIGIASSTDNGVTWIYRGIAQNLEFKSGRNTFRSPEIIFVDQLYHMYCTYVEGIPNVFTGKSSIVHYTSNNLWDWVYEGTLSLSSNCVMDACIQEINPGIYKMWYKDAENASIYSCISTDLYRWAVLGREISEEAQNCPNVFCYKDHKWMITEAKNGMNVYGSNDYYSWEKKNTILQEPGIRSMDSSQASQADILVCGEDAYLFYSVHPNVDKYSLLSPDFISDYKHRRSVIQAVKLDFDGYTLICNRNEELHINLLK